MSGVFACTSFGSMSSYAAIAFSRCGSAFVGSDRLVQMIARWLHESRKAWMHSGGPSSLPPSHATASSRSVSPFTGSSVSTAITPRRYLSLARRSSSASTMASSEPAISTTRS